MAAPFSQPRTTTALIESEPDVERYATCPRCHTKDSRISQDALAAGEGWRCSRCGQNWDAARLKTVAAYERWTLEHDQRTAPHAETRHVSARGVLRIVPSPPPPKKRKSMDIKIEERVVGQVTVLDIAGRLTIHQGAQHLEDEIRRLISQERTQIVLNLENVPYIDSGGLGELVASYGSVMKAGGALKLLHVNSRNHDLLSITRLVTVFESFDGEAEAVQSFQTFAPSA